MPSLLHQVLLSRLGGTVGGITKQVEQVSCHHQLREGGRTVHRSDAPVDRASVLPCGIRARPFATACQDGNVARVYCVSRAVRVSIDATCGGGGASHAVEHASSCKSGWDGALVAPACRAWAAARPASRRPGRARWRRTQPRPARPAAPGGATGQPPAASNRPPSRPPRPGAPARAHAENARAGSATCRIWQPARRRWNTADAPHRSHLPCA